MAARSSENKERVQNRGQVEVLSEKFGEHLGVYASLCSIVYCKATTLYSAFITNSIVTKHCIVAVMYVLMFILYTVSVNSFYGFQFS